jgi:arginine decarboxylase
VTASVDHQRAPLFDTLTEYARGGIYPLHTPGHKGGRFAGEDLRELVGAHGLTLDLPSMTATDNTFHPTGCVRDAQRLASDLVGAEASFFLAAGSTLGVAAAMLAAVPPGATIVLPRNIHRSVVAGLILSGGQPRFIQQEVLVECGALGVTDDAVATTLAAEPRPAAVLLTRPSYYGLARDLAGVAALCHDLNVPLIIDEAHGAHFHWLPKGGPESALSAGADIAIQSWHKTLGSLVGSAMLHVGRDSLVAPNRVQDALNCLQTTSPSLLLLASLDLVRRRLWREGERLFADAVRETHELEAQIDLLPGLRALRPESDPRLAGHRRDPLRLVVNVTESGWTGYEVERHLRTEFQVEDEMADVFNVVYILSPEDDWAARRRLIAGLKTVSDSPKPGSESVRLAKSETASRLLQPWIPSLGMLPREAALSEKSSIDLRRAAGQVCAEMVMFYPPGIPLLMPGELISEGTADICQQLLAAGAHPYASDPTLQTVRIVKRS